MSTRDPDPEEPLADWLRRLPSPSPDPKRRTEIRRAFLAGAAPSRPADSLRISSPMDAAPDAGDDEAFAAWLRASAPPQRASDEARRRARLAFLGTLAGDGPRLRRESRWFQGTVLALAAAAIVAVTLFVPAGDRWSVRLEGPVRFADEEFLPGEDERLAVALEAAGTLATGSAGARLSLSDALELELRPATELLLPALPELDGGEPVEFELARGETYLRTLAGFPGNPVRVRTGVAEVSLQGTAIGVLVDAQGTCVCVAEGTAHIASRLDPLVARDVSAGWQWRLSLGVPESNPEPFAAPGSGPEAVHSAELLEFTRRP